MKYLLLRIIALVVLSALVLKPLLEYITGTNEEPFNYIWFIDIGILIILDILLEPIASKYFNK
jgi:hypothetical protein